MEMEVQQKADLPTRISGILWGKTGCGKTTFLSSMPGKKLYIMIDPDGKDSIPPNTDYAVLDLSMLNDGETVRALKDKVPSMIRDLKDDTASVIVDSLTVYAERGLNHAIQQNVGAGKDFKPSIEAPGQTAYGARRQYIVHATSNILRATALRGMHCFFTTHDTEITNTKGEVINHTMMLGGKANNDVGLKISECWWLREHDGKRFIAVRNCRSREPIKSRMFASPKEPEFELKFNPSLGVDQPHSIATWYKQWIDGNRQKLPLPT